MASDNQNQVSETSVTRETIKGAAKGAAAPFVAAGVTAAGGAAVAAAVVAPPYAAYKLSSIVHRAAGSGAKGKLAVAAVWAVGLIVSATAAIGGVLGFGKGVVKANRVQRSSEEQGISREQAAVQQAYLAGAQAGQAHVLNELQKAQEAQLAQVQGNPTNFAGKVAQKKDSISPEAIAKQREAAASAAPQVG